MKQFVFEKGADVLQPDNGENFKKAIANINKFCAAFEDFAEDHIKPWRAGTFLVLRKEKGKISCVYIFNNNGVLENFSASDGDIDKYQKEILKEDQFKKKNSAAKSGPFEKQA